jgi:putative tryptophan/tyrosine transport system substrate-binding protein
MDSLQLRAALPTPAPTLLLCLLAVLSLFLCVPAFGDVVIVKSSDAEPYKQAEATLHDQLSRPDCNVRSVLVKQLAESGIGLSISTTDTVVAVGTSAAAWLHSQLPGGVELVYCMVNNAGEVGLLKGDDCWGVTTNIPVAEQFKLIAEALPSARTVGALYASDTPAGRDALQALKEMLPHDWHVEAVAVNDYSSVAEAIEALTLKKVDVIWTTSDSKIYDAAAVRALLLSALRSKIPVWGYSPAFVRAGALIGVGVDPKAQAAQAADLIKQLRQHKESIVEKAQAPHEYQIALNLIVADQLNIVIPDAMVQRATYVFRSEK